MKNYFKENLKKIRKDYNLSQEQLAEEIGVSRQAISKWESSLAYPEMDKILTLCNKFNLNVDDLLHKDISEIKGEMESKNKINKSMDDFLNFITDSFNLFSRMSFKSKIKCLFEQFLILLLLYIISSILVEVCSMFFASLFSFLPSNANNFIMNILSSIIIVFCFIASIVVWTRLFKVRYLDYFEKFKSEKGSEEESQTIPSSNASPVALNESTIIIRDPKHGEYRFFNGLMKIIIGIIKFWTLLIVLFLCCMLICLFMSLVMSFLVYKTGWFFIGLLLSILSTSLATTIILLMLLNFVFNRKSNKKVMIISFISSFITLGIGVGLIFIGTLSFDVLKDNETMLKIETKEYTMHDGLFFNLDNLDDEKYIESDINNIRVEYSINNLCETESYEHDNGVIIYGKCPNYFKLMRESINNINNKKIIPITSDLENVKIYASRENIKLLKENANKYFN